MMFELLLGHLVGDYLLQNNWMALNKSKYNFLGWSSCLIHCILYTLAVCFIMNNCSIIWITIVFLSHFILDKFGLPEKYLQLIRGRSLVNFVKNPDYANYTPIVGLHAGFTTFVYVVVDNTMHILIMWGGFNYVQNIS